jgi:hypothetical protein
MQMTQHSTSRQPERVFSNPSMIIVMVVYALFGAAGFFAASRILTG